MYQKECVDRISPDIGNSGKKKSALEEAASGIPGAQKKLDHFLNRGANKPEAHGIKKEADHGATCHDGAYLMPKPDCGLFSEAQESIQTPCSWKQGGHRVSLRKTYGIRGLTIKVTAIPVISLIKT